ncbi:GatB/YqeY domain-containing protein [Candidatus Falkowbacteria bacterium]|nr:GatB/YqeY domain-containing protein [Candidatus Falkowbacteria bacterium]
MTLQPQIEQDFLNAFKGGDKFAVDTLRLLKAAVQNKKIEKLMAKEAVLPDEEMVGLIKSEIKKRQDSIDSYRQGNRNDLAEKEEAEIKILEKYLPEQLSEDKLIEIIKGVIGELGAAGLADFGKVMGAVVARVKGQAEGQVISRIVKAELGHK